MRCRPRPHGANQVRWWCGEKTSVRGARRWCRCDVFHGARRANNLPTAHPLPHLCHAPPAATAAASQACTCSCSCMCAFVCATDLNKAGLRYTKKNPSNLMIKGRSRKQKKIRARSLPRCCIFPTITILQLTVRSTPCVCTLCWQFGCC